MDLVAIAGHFVSYSWVIRPHNFLVILWNVLVQDCWSCLNVKVQDCRCRMFRRPHVHHPCFRWTYLAGFDSCSV